MSCYRIVLADDHTVLRSGLKMLLESQPDFTVVAEAADGDSAIKATIEHRPDVVILDLAMPGADGFCVVREIKRIAPQTRLVVLTMHDGRSYYQSAIAAGADGFVPKNTADAELMTAIRSKEVGKYYGPQQSSQTSPSPHEASRIGSTEETLSALSERERAVLIGVSRGLTNQQMAKEMSLSVKSIESYRSRLMQKLGVVNRAQLVELAVSHGLLFFHRDEKL